MGNERRESKGMLTAGGDRNTEFFLTLSHQLKAPLAVIEWCLQLVGEKSTGLGTKERELLRRAKLQADNMVTLITDMQQMVRLINRHRDQTEYASVDVNRLLKQIFTDMELVAARRGVHLEWGAIENLPPVFLEELYLKQAVVNLLDNAVKYTPEGGKVTLSAAKKSGWVQIEVTDQGIGISEADRRHLFTEFFRGHEARQMTNDGTGLGLVLVKRIVEEFDGEIEVKSQLGHGSTFTLRIPST